MLSLLLPAMMAGGERKFYNASDLYGVSVSEPNSVCKDADGFLWVASKNGVLRIADNGSRTYQLPYSSMNVVSVELEHREGRLVAFTNQGEIFRYDREADKFVRCLDLVKALRAESVYLSQVRLDDEGRMWLGGSAGMQMYKDGKLMLLKGIDGAVGDMVISERGTVIVGGPEGIFEIYPDKPGMKKISACGSVFPTLLKPDKKLNRIWVGTMADGLHYVDMATGQLVKARASDFPRQYVRDIEIVSDSSIWCGIDGRGIYELTRDGSRVTAIHRELPDGVSTLSGNGVQDMWYDSPERMWICTYTGGLQFTDMSTSAAELLTHRNDNPNSLVNNYVYDLEEDRQGNLWIGTNGGLSCLETASGKWTNLFDNRGNESFIVQAVCQDADGNIWVGTYSHGVYVINVAEKRIEAHYTTGSDILTSTGFVFDIVCDGRGDIWIAGMIGNILKFDREKKEFESYPSVPVNAMTDFDDSTLLLLSTNKLMKLDKKSREVTTLLEGSMIRDMEVVGNQVWLATSGNGLIKYDMRIGKEDSLDTKNGFPSDYINSLVYNDGFLWIGTSQGLFRLNMADNNVTEFRYPALAATQSFTPGAVKALNMGGLAWGTSTGLLIVAETSGGENPGGGHIFLDNILLNGVSVRDIPALHPGSAVDSITSITLDHTYNDITFYPLSLGAMSFSPRFSYKLEGYDDSWSAPAELTKIKYSGLPPGDYVMKIRMHNPGVTDERSITIRITPPFWHTWWFAALMVASAVGIVLFVRRYVVRVSPRGKKAADEKSHTAEIPDDAVVASPALSATQPVSDGGGNVSSIGKAGAASAPASAPQPDPFATQAVEVIMSHLDNPDFGKEEFARAMGVSTSLLFKKIKSSTGLSVVDFIKKVRMEQAMKLLADSSLSIGEIAYRCGFSTVGYFSTVFKKYFGKTPSECRNNLN